MQDKEMVYAVTRIRAKENTLLSREFLMQLSSAEDLAAAKRLLRDKGWQAEEADDVSAILHKEKEKHTALIHELLGEDAGFLDVFSYEADYANLKAAVKETALKQPYEGIFTDDGRVEAATVQKAVAEKDFLLLPADMREAAQEALGLFLQTGDGQLCDVLIDAACLAAMQERAKASGSEFFKRYANQTAAAANIRICLRAIKTGKDRAFLDKALAPCEALDISRLKAAALSGKEALMQMLSTTDFALGAEALKTSLSAFERWCDDSLTEVMRPQKSNSFGIDPIAAYDLAKRNELKSVRVILSGKRNRLPEEKIRERIRNTYV